MTIVEYMDQLIAEGKPVDSWRVCADDSDAIDFLDAHGVLVARTKNLLP